MKMRLIIDQPKTAAENMAIDEAIMRNCKKLGLPTLRLYSWKPPTVSIGYFQSLNEEVDLLKCKECGVDYVRRITGGGAVLHDKELTYSFVCAADGSIVPKNILESYRKICQGIIFGLDKFGLSAQFVPLNDIIVNHAEHSSAWPRATAVAQGSKKISGQAQTRRENVILQHGTVLLDVDVDKMFSILKVPNEKMRDKIVQDVKQRVTSLKHELGREIGFDEMAGQIAKGFATTFEAEFARGALSAHEKKLAEKIAKEKFSKKEWNEMR